MTQKIIKETKSTCKSCGHVWYWGMTDTLDDLGVASQDILKAGLCCTGCLPAILIPSAKKNNLYIQCPKCNSKNITKEQIKHLVPTQKNNIKVNIFDNQEITQFKEKKKSESDFPNEFEDNPHLFIITIFIFSSILDLLRGV